MASILRVNTITDASSNNSVAMSVVSNGSAKAWISFDGSAGTPAAIDSFGTSTLTDNGTGDQSQTLTSAMANASYIHSGSAGVNDGSGNAASQRVYGYNTARTQSTTVYNINTSYDNSNAINSYVVSVVHGELA